MTRETPDKALGRNFCKYTGGPWGVAFRIQRLLETLDKSERSSARSNCSGDDGVLD